VSKLEISNSENQLHTTSWPQVTLGARPIQKYAVSNTALENKNKRIAISMSDYWKA
jgi:hypothetical protein